MARKFPKNSTDTMTLAQICILCRAELWGRASGYDTDTMILCLWLERNSSLQSEDLHGGCCHLLYPVSGRALGRAGFLSRSDLLGEWLVHPVACPGHKPVVTASPLS
jgi:hypothetical protein